MQMPSLFNGVSGVKSHANALNSVSDNIANLSTAGFKGTRPLFSDIMSNKLYTASEEVQQVGNGSVVAAQNIMTQASFESTDNPLDMGINGDGFFTLRPEDGTDIYYSRAGQFHVDLDGYLVNSLGYRVQGVTADESGVVGAAALGDIQFTFGQAESRATSLVDLTLNLDAGDTRYHLEGDAIDPDDADTFNYTQAVKVYDADGASHELATYYQRLSSYSGPTPAGSSSVWKAQVFENTASGLVANPLYPADTYYMHFDTDGHLVGLSSNSPAVGDSYTAAPGLTSAGGQVSDRLGETFSYTGAGSAQTLATTATVSFSGGTLAGDSLTIGGTTITLGANASGTAAANDLADQINANASLDVYAQASGAVVVLRSKSGTASDLSASGTTIAVDDDTSLSQLVGLINNGLASTGSLDLGALAAGDTVTVAGATFTEGVDFSDAATLATAINVAALGVTASSNGGDSVYLTADSVGAAGDAIALASTGGITTSAANLLGGLDDSAANLVQASLTTSGNRQYLHLARTDTGATAVLAMDDANTLGSGLSLDFNTFTQNTIAADAQSTSEDEGQVAFDFDFGDAGVQNVAFNYNPEGASATTQSAGGSEIAYLYQDGIFSGALESLEVDNLGNIIGTFSNGDIRTLAAVTLTNFKSPESLRRYGDNLWAATDAAGAPVLGLPGGIEGMGTIEGGSLEASNVDLAREFVNLINYQRAYQANTKSITTSDEMMKEAINLKR